ncbi:unnamed protein product [Durusdinium trenchii]|uniref:Uncharacterized protein n=2 Tax=Durusdinium trenchii TaxID=1381693 RepID=A0ABP0SMP9_9DINO|eukprot:g30988.t1
MRAAVFFMLLIQTLAMRDTKGSEKMWPFDSPPKPGYCDAQKEDGSEEGHCRGYKSESDCTAFKFCMWLEGKVDPGYCDLKEGGLPHMKKWCRRTPDFDTCLSPNCKWTVGVLRGRCALKTGADPKQATYCTETVTRRDMCERADHICTWIED